MLFWIEWGLAKWAHRRHCQLAGLVLQWLQGHAADQGSDGLSSHESTRERQRRMRIQSPGHEHRFLSAYGAIASFFYPLPAFTGGDALPRNHALGVLPMRGPARRRSSMGQHRIAASTLIMMHKAHMMR
jgi:hypothetical protein